MQTFEEWEKGFKKYLLDQIGIHIEDLPDHDYDTFYKEGLSYSDVLQIIMVDVDLIS